MVRQCALLDADAAQQYVYVADHLRVMPATESGDILAVRQTEIRPFGDEGAASVSAKGGLGQAEKVSANLRDKVLSGVLAPGAHLSEAALCEELLVSRNTLREAFRLLTREGLLRHVANRGVFVTAPSSQAIADIYRVRRTIECSAIEGAFPEHPAIGRMKEAVARGDRCKADEDWLGVGSADIAFHTAIVELADSPRLSAFFSQLSLELRLGFGLLPDAKTLHAPYLARNKAILAQLEQGKPRAAAKSLEAYLVHAERFILSFLRSEEGSSS